MVLFRNDSDLDDLYLYLVAAPVSEDSSWGGHCCQSVLADDSMVLICGHKRCLGLRCRFGDKAWVPHHC
jgi:hypothetical protein